MPMQIMIVSFYRGQITFVVAVWIHNFLAWFVLCLPLLIIPKMWLDGELHRFAAKMNFQRLVYLFLRGIWLSELILSYIIYEGKFTGWFFLLIFHRRIFFWMIWSILILYTLKKEMMETLLAKCPPLLERKSLTWKVYWPLWNHLFIL